MPPHGALQEGETPYVVRDLGEALGKYDDDDNEIESPQIRNLESS